MLKHKVTFSILLLLFCHLCFATGTSAMQLVTLDSPNHAVLRQHAQKIQFPLDVKTKKIIEELQSFFTTLENPAGLAAPQVNHSLQIAIIQIPEDTKKIRKNVYDTLPPTIFINPSYTPIESEGKEKDWEGCFSVNNKAGEVYRYKAIKYEAYTLDGKKVSGIARGFLARVMQHEIGHLNGELFIDLKCADCRIGPIDEMMKIRKAEMAAH